MKSLLLIPILLCGCSSPVKQSLKTPTVAKHATVKPPAPPGFSDAASVVAQVIQPPPSLTTLTLAWDTYTDPAASNLLVMGSSNAQGPFTNVLTISPPNAQSNCVVSSPDPNHFYRLAVQ